MGEDRARAAASCGTAVIVERQPIEVAYVTCADEVAAIRDAWKRLESHVEPKGRHFYGACYGDGVYRACVERLAGDETGSLEVGSLPGGRYVRERLRGDPPAVYDRIPEAFKALEARASRDPSRPGIEHYRRRDEIDVLLPCRDEIDVLLPRRDDLRH